MNDEIDPRTGALKFSKDRIETLRALAANRKRHYFWLIPLGIAVLGALVQLIFPTATFGIWVILVGLVGVALGAYAQQSPGQTVRAYDAAYLSWAKLLQRSHPNETLVVDFPLQETERVFYSEPCQRYEERRTGQVIDTQSRTKNAVGGAFVGAVVAGPAGAIVGGGMARRQTTGTATDVYAVVPIDEGVLSVTSMRVLFLGKRDTIEVPNSRIIRIIEVERSDRVSFDYAGRAAGESYSVNPPLFNLSMVRRARDVRFALPIPPAPLASDVMDAITREHRILTASPDVFSE